MIATNEFRGSGAGERTEYHNLVAWDRLAEICGQFLSKGQLIDVEGLAAAVQRLTGRALAGLGELRTTLEGIQVPAEPVLLFRGGLLFERLARFGREPQFEYLPRRHRVLTANDHDVPEYLFEQGRPGRHLARPAR